MNAFSTISASQHCNDKRQSEHLFPQESHKSSLPHPESVDIHEVFTKAIKCQISEKRQALVNILLAFYHSASDSNSVKFATVGRK